MIQVSSSVPRSPHFYLQPSLLPLSHFLCAKIANRTYVHAMLILEISLIIHTSIFSSQPTFTSRHVLDPPTSPVPSVSPSTLSSLRH
ncbi:hypothetical protein EYC80_004894 [Monilinia laxa]|uniref:Uncharacterized protein n=1 Tax=Monilinia laxa TaxID=61186 RepID=A0A5N6KI73_MONLA|nr:hypothetical protein EYC80_004894 [Monilinia laxa]